jgi:hypothetical protein
MTRVSGGIYLLAALSSDSPLFAKPLAAVNTVASHPRLDRYFTIANRRCPPADRVLMK